MAKAKFRVGDKVKVIGMPPLKFARGVKDEPGTKRLFKSMLGRVYTVCGFDKIGNVELEPKRLNTVWIEPEFLRLRGMAKVIPPRSRVRLVRADKLTHAWRKDVGRRFRIGYYSRKDGLDCIWLVNDNGEYEQTTDREFLLKYFEIDQLSNEASFYGTGKTPLAKLKKVASDPARSRLTR